MTDAELAAMHISHPIAAALWVRLTVAADCVAVGPENAAGIVDALFCSQEVSAVRQPRSRQDAVCAAARNCAAAIGALRPGEMDFERRLISIIAADLENMAARQACGEWRKP